MPLFFPHRCKFPSHIISLQPEWYSFAFLIVHSCCLPVFIFVIWLRFCFLVCFQLFSSCLFFLSFSFLPPPPFWWAVWLAGSLFPGQRSGLSLCGGSIELRTLECQRIPGPGNINQWELSQRSPSQLQDLAPPNSLQAPVLKAPHQTTSKTGTQTQPSAERLPNVI